MVPQQVSFVERSSLSQRVPYRRLKHIVSWICISWPLYLMHNYLTQDVKSSKDLVSEMHRIVDFNVSQVIDFELRQAHTTL